MEPPVIFDIKTRKLAKKNLTVRLDPEIRRMLEAIAEVELRTLANQITLFLQKGIADYMLENKIKFVESDDGRRLEVKRDDHLYFHGKGTECSE